MSVTHRGRPVAPVEALPASAPARRVGRRRWQDPRLWVGVLLVAASVLIGARLLAGADDTVAVWRVTQPLRVGDEVTRDVVEVAHVRFAQPETEDAYLAADVPLPPGLRVDRSLGVGELLPDASVSAVDVTLPHRLPLGVTAAGLPMGLVAGDRVDVWAVPGDDAERRSSERVLDDVTVVALSDSGPSGLASDRQVVVAVPEGVDLGDVLDRLSGATVVLVQVGG